MTFISTFQIPSRDRLHRHNNRRPVQPSPVIARPPRDRRRREPNQQRRQRRVGRRSAAAQRRDEQLWQAHRGVDDVGRGDDDRHRGSRHGQL